jgi:hypothetical protein
MIDPAKEEKGWLSFLQAPLTLFTLKRERDSTNGQDPP